MEHTPKLTTEERGMLENLIETHMESIPLWISLLRNQELKKYLQFKDETDVVYGMILGAIFEKFNFWYLTNHFGQSMSNDTVFEVNRIVFKRAQDIREAIFKCG